MCRQFKFLANFYIKQRMAGVKMLLGIVMSGLVLLPNAAHSDDGFYFGIGLPSVAIGGDFDGSRALVSNDGSVILRQSDVDDAVGTKFILGFQGGQTLWEGSITMSDHDASFGPISTPTEFFSLNFDGKYLFSHGDSISPYGVLGVGLTTLTISNGACDSGGCNSNAEYSGVDFRLGGGVELQLADKLAISLQALKRFGSYSTAKGKGNSGSLENNIDSDGLTLSAEIKYIILE